MLSAIVPCLLHFGLQQRRYTTIGTFDLRNDNSIMESHISTRFLVLSDTHGEDLRLRCPAEVDVAIHCGDLTEESKLDEFKTAI